MSDFAINGSQLLSDSAGKRLGRFRGLGRALIGEVRLGEYDDYYPTPELGELRAGVARIGDTIKLSGIWKRHHIKGKIVYYCEPYYIPKDPKSASQLSWRAKMRDAVTAWHALTSNQKAVYNNRHGSRGQTGFNKFIKEFLLS